MTTFNYPLTTETLAKLRARHYFDDSDFLDRTTGTFRPGVSARLRLAAERESLIPRPADEESLEAALDIYQPLPHFIPLSVAAAILGKRNVDTVRKCQPAGAGWLVPTDALHDEYERRVAAHLAAKAKRQRGRPPQAPRLTWPFPETVSTLEVEWTTDPGSLPDMLAACLPRRQAQPAEFQVSHRDLVSKEWAKRPFEVRHAWHLVRWVGQVIDFYDLSGRRSSPPTPVGIPTSTVGILSVGNRGPKTSSNPDPKATSSYYCERCQTVYKCFPGKEAMALASHKVHSGTPRDANPAVSKECWPEYTALQAVEAFPELVNSPIIQSHLSDDA